jgi:hypothetical protein
VLGVLSVAVLAPLVTVFMALKAAITTIAGILIATFSPVILGVTAAIAAVVAIFVVLQKKFGILDPLIDAVSNAFIRTKNAIGQMLVGLAEKLDFIPGAGKLKEFGESLQTVVEENVKTVETIRKATREEMIAHNKKKIAEAEAEREKIAKTREETGDKRFGRIRDEFARDEIRMRKRLVEKLENQTDAEFEAEQKRKEDAKKQDEKLGEIKDATKDTAKQTAEINEKTVGEIKTQASFLDETANMLGRSIEGILGIGRDTTSQEMLEELRVANEQRAAQQNQPNDGMTNTGS